ncbi:hypothetical protein [Chitinophaga arvensicola]|uniref:hypothetical protein n=1 Tax=Chitinophaga arvensicola TaxID=29529 RepID=UPI00115FF622|nr:hypothetical protein [Chitinophaga arvensicola]
MVAATAAFLLLAFAFTLTGLVAATSAGCGTPDVEKRSSWCIVVKNEVTNIFYEDEVKLLAFSLSFCTSIFWGRTDDMLPGGIT